MEQLLVIIIVYKKNIFDLSLVRNILKTNEYNLSVLIYDNSPSRQSTLTIKQNNIYYVHDINNSGVSKGFNTGILKAKELNKKYVLLLDQDTEFTISHIDEYMKLEKKYNDKYIYSPLVGKKDKLYSPFYERNFIGKGLDVEHFYNKEIYNLKNKSIINSGLMIPLSIVNQIGMYNEKIKLDFSDIYFIEKYKSSNNKAVLVNILLEHSLSADEGLNFESEMNRFKYFCNGAKELSLSLSKNTFLVVIKRTLSLVYKYKTLSPISLCIDYYIKGKNI